MLKVFLCSFAIAAVSTWVAIKLATKFNILDFPAERKIHAKPIPLLGGVAVFFAYVVALLVNFRFSWQLKGVVISATFIMLAGLVDDVKGLSAGIRLLVQTLGALLLISFGVYINIIPDNWPFAFPIEVFITVLWIVGITNALNFIDGVDGLAAGLTMIAAGTFFVIASQTGQGYFAFLNIALVGACLGFVIFNFYPARIFLGDAGSSFLGFTLASLAVMGEWAEGRPIVALSVPVLVLAVLIFDMIYITVSRIGRGKVKSFKEWIEYVGTDHLHHRLIGLGFSQRQTVLFVYFICIIFSVGALILKEATAYQAILLLLQGAFVLVSLAILMIVGRSHMDRSRLYEDRLKELRGEAL
ncbi:MAG: MraY family glycosyltransferase [Candidatus Omnitrophota bacterium]